MPLVRARKPVRCRADRLTGVRGPNRPDARLARPMKMRGRVAYLQLDSMSRNPGDMRRLTD